MSRILRGAVAAMLLAASVAACRDTPTDVQSIPTVSALSIVNGDAQTGEINEALTSRLTVRAVTAEGLPAAGIRIAFRVATGAAVVSPATDTSDANGEASTTVTMGNAAGTVRVKAAIEGTAIAAMFSANSILPDPDSTSAPQVYNPDWTTASHGKSAPDYVTVFPQNAVNSIEISMSASQWSDMQTNVTSLFGFDFGAHGDRSSPYPETDPDYTAVTVKFNGKLWKKVGFRLKGNSSLSHAWNDGNYKLPFRLNTSEFDSTYPAILGQHLYGFKELSFAPGFDDPSLIREKSAADIMRLAGVPAAQTAFYRVYIDFGQGRKYCGVYTMVEVIDDTMVKNQFGEDKGNIYKPESSLSVFAQSGFEKKNNKSGSYADVQAFIAALNDPIRVGDRATWRSNLEATFDVNHFLRWLAVNNAIVNFDVYGTVAHNYYLYNSPTSKLTWIPWDENESLRGNPPVAGVVAGELGSSLTMNEVSSYWPLIRYLADDSVYNARYKTYLKYVNDSALVQVNINAMFDRYTALISPYVLGSNGERAGYTWTTPALFSQSAQELKAHIQNRKALLSSYVP